MTDNLLKGFQEYRASVYEGDNPIMDQLIKEGQNPDYFIISCIDSRANPGTIFKPAPGTFFAHKAMGAIVRPYNQGTALAAALHFAITYNKVKTIIVMGHTNCGAIDAMIQGIPDEEISTFLDVAKTGLKKAIEKHPHDHDAQDLHRHTEEEIILESIENLKEYPSVKKALSDSKLSIKPWLFDMEQGAIYEHSTKTNKFEDLTNA
jgi:carbonic anhydrase